jgi:hypothetical protein
MQEKPDKALGQPPTMPELDETIFSLDPEGGVTTRMRRRSAARHRSLLRAAVSASSSDPRAAILATFSQWSAILRKPSISRLWRARAASCRQSSAYLRYLSGFGVMLSRRVVNSIGIAPVHSITSSAGASSVANISSPGTLAILRLMINSTLVDCRTGRSVRFAPLENAAGHRCPPGDTSQPGRCRSSSRRRLWASRARAMIE